MDSRTFHENAISSLIVGADLRSLAPGSVVTAEEPANWGIDGFPPKRSKKNRSQRKKNRGRTMLLGWSVKGSYGNLEGGE
jgi:hypothetical protein